MAAKREGVARAGGRDLAEPEERAHPCRQDSIDAAVEEQGEVKRGVELPHDAVGRGWRAETAFSGRLRYALFSCCSAHTLDVSRWMPWRWK